MNDLKTPKIHAECYYSAFLVKKMYFGSKLLHFIVLHNILRLLTNNSAIVVENEIN